MPDDGDKNGHKCIVRLSPSRQDRELTIDNDGGSGATALRHDVLGHTGVVGCVGEPRLLDDQVVIDGDVEVPVVRWVDDLLILQPLHLTGEGWRGWRGAR